MSKRLQKKPMHPGEILREQFMAEFGLSINRTARDLRVPVTRIADIVHERRAITPDTAYRLARYFGTTPEFWMARGPARDRARRAPETGRLIRGQATKSRN